MRKWLPGLHENRRTLSSAGFRSSSLAATEHAPAARACAVGAAEVSAISCPGRAESRGAASLPHLGREAGSGKEGAAAGSSSPRARDPPRGEAGGSRFSRPNAPLRERLCVREGERSPRRSAAHGPARGERPRPPGAVGAGPLRALLSPRAVSAAPPGAAACCAERLSVLGARTYRRREPVPSRHEKRSESPRQARAPPCTPSPQRTQP